jgi:hypothetical protein
MKILRAIRNKLQYSTTGCEPTTLLGFQNMQYVFPAKIPLSCRTKQQMMCTRGSFHMMDDALPFVKKSKCQVLAFVCG